MTYNGTNSTSGPSQNLRQVLLLAVDEVLNDSISSPFVCDPRLSSATIGGMVPSSSTFYSTGLRAEQFPTSFPTVTNLNQNCLSYMPIQSLLQQQRRCTATTPAMSITFSDYARSGITHPSSTGSSSFFGRSLQAGSLPLSLPPHMCSSRSKPQLSGTVELNQRDIVQLLIIPRARNQHSLNPAILASQRTSALAQRQRDVSDVKKMANELLQNKQHEVIKTLVAIGLRARKRTDPYIDVLSLDLPPAPSGPANRSNEIFPEKLHRMLRDSQDGDGGGATTGQDGFSDVVSFLPHGRAFVVHDIDRFVQEIMPRYFPQQTFWCSFTRQLNLWGFLKIQSGPDASVSPNTPTTKTGFAAAGGSGNPYGGRVTFYHELFLQSRPELCLYIRRVGASTGREDRRKLRHLNARSTKLEDPDFYTMRPATHAKP